MERRAGRESLDAHHAQHGLLDLPDLIEAASALDYAFVAFTDHSKSLKIARGCTRTSLPPWAPRSTP
jgi:histidinol phosphatase-like PHP family hydrolase